jgi:SAM-dependent methyltransferase
LSASIAAERNGAMVWHSIDEITVEICFDVIVATDVIEHVSDPGLLIKKLMGKLNSGGVVIITTGDANNYIWNMFGANWWYCFYPEHISFISKDWLDFFCKKYHTQLLYIEYFRYSKLPIVSFASYFVLTILYGLSAKLYQSFVKVLNEIRGYEGSGHQELQD